MISRLIDELNKSADEWNGSNMFELAHMCRDAADTIWQLRDDLQRANAENAKLRKKADMLQWNSDCFIKIYGSWKRLRATVPHLERENAKLWELVSETLIRLAAANEAAGGGFIDARYCELLESHGIEVDG